MKKETETNEKFVVVKGKKYCVEKNCLELPNLDIIDLGEIEGLENISDSLILMNLRGNDLETISRLPSMPNLKNLDLDQNRLTNLEGLDNVPHLTNLSAVGNEISSINGLESLDMIKGLDLSENHITSMKELESFHALEELSLRANLLNEICGIDSMNQLKMLLLSQNNLKELNPLENKSSLETLWINENQISSIDSLSGCTNLAELDIRDNQITNIDVFAQLPNLYLVHAENNLITNLPPLDTFMHANEEYVGGGFFFSNNQIETIKMNHEIIVGELWLDHNRLTDAEWILHIWLEDTFDLHIMDNPFTPEAEPIFEEYQRITEAGERKPWKIPERI
ncbi:MAG TPA: leucine-rich repeat domain-containing protein [Candidatus Lokiarchaeia archaeon]|nr:leucine-rich repeat domain-containing protein [Candidatus Lokiarchaeia archaeon]